MIQMFVSSHCQCLYKPIKAFGLMESTQYHIVESVERKNTVLSSKIQQKVFFSFLQKKYSRMFDLSSTALVTVIFKRNPLTCQSCINYRSLVSIASLLLVSHLVSDGLCSRQFQMCKSRTFLFPMHTVSFSLISDFIIYLNLLLFLLFLLFLCQSIKSFFSFYNTMICNCFLDLKGKDGEQESREAGTFNVILQPIIEAQTLI